MRAAAQSAEINDDGDEQPEQIDSFGRHVVVDFPGVDEGGERQEKEAEHGDEESGGEGSLEVGGGEPHQREGNAREKQDDDEKEARHSWRV